MRPFEYIVKHHHSLMIRDMVVRCTAQMVSGQAPRIR